MFLIDKRPVFSSISAKTILKLLSMTARHVEMYDIAGIIISSSFCRFNDLMDNIKASVPDAHPTEYLILDNFEKASSKFFTSLNLILN